MRRRRPSFDSDRGQRRRALPPTPTLTTKDAAWRRRSVVDDTRRTGTTARDDAAWHLRSALNASGGVKVLTSDAAQPRQDLRTGHRLARPARPDARSTRRDGFRCRRRRRSDGAVRR
jgi:hypothetical protein